MSQHRWNIKNLRELGKPYRVAWRTTPSRQAMHRRKPRNGFWRHESSGGPSTPPGGFWKFPETRQNSTQLQNTQPIHPE